MEGRQGGFVSMAAGKCFHGCPATVCCCNCVVGSSIISGWFVGLVKGVRMLSKRTAPIFCLFPLPFGHILFMSL